MVFEAFRLTDLKALTWYLDFSGESLFCGGSGWVETANGYE